MTVPLGVKKRAGAPPNEGDVDEISFDSKVLLLLPTDDDDGAALLFCSSVSNLLRLESAQITINKMKL